MWWFLVLLGLLIAIAGLSVLVLGVSIFVTTFGNALVTTGAVAASGGFIIIAMGLVLRQLESLNRRLEAVLAGNRLERVSPGDDDVALSEITPPVSAERTERNTADLRQAEFQDLDQRAPEPRAPEPQAPASVTAAPVAPPTSRNKAPAVAEEHEEAPEPAAPRLPPYLRAQRDHGQAAPAAEKPVEAPAASLAVSEPDLAPEPQIRAPRAPEPPPLRRSAEQNIEAEVDSDDEPRILKSGIVGGMAYTLYSDGSIQAELPDGVVRFASLQDLREHVSRAQAR